MSDAVETPEEFLNRWKMHFAPLVGRASEEYAHHQTLMRRDIQAGETWRGVSRALDCLVSGGRLVGFQVAATGAPPDRTLLTEVVHYGMWAWGCVYERLTRENLSPFDPTGYERSMLWLLCVVRACEMPEAFSWLSSYVYESFVKGGMDGGGPQDKDFNNFFWLMSKSIKDGRWHAESKEGEEVGLYEPLFAAKDDASLTRAAARVCERVVRARLDGELNADGEHSIYEYDPWGTLPVDLVAFRAIRQSLTGEVLELGRGHPLLNAPFKDFPQLADLNHDSVFEPISSAARSLFGQSWRPWPSLHGDR